MTRESRNAALSSDSLLDLEDFLMALQRISLTQTAMGPPMGKAAIGSSTRRGCPAGLPGRQL